MARKESNSQMQMYVAGAVGALVRAAEAVRGATSQEITWPTGPHGAVDEQAEAYIGADPSKLSDDELAQAISKLRGLHSKRAVEHLMDARKAVDYYNAIETASAAFEEIYELRIPLMEALSARRQAADEQEKVSLKRELDVDSTLTSMIADQQRRQMPVGRILDLIHEQGVALEDVRKAIDARSGEAGAKEAHVLNKQRPVKNKARGAQTKSVNPMD